MPFDLDSLPAVALVAALLCTVGHLGACFQHRLTWFLAWSGLAQVGYLLMGLATLTSAGLAASLVGLVAFVLALVGALVVLVPLRAALGGSDYRDLRGAIRRAPIFTILLAIFLLSLMGVPPLLGGLARFQLLTSIAEASRVHSTMANWLLGLLLVAGFNLVLGGIATLSVLRVLILEPRAEDLEGLTPVPAAEPIARWIVPGVLAVLLIASAFVLDPLVGAAQSLTASAHTSTARE